MMPFCPISRARPLLGTLVAIRVEGLPETQAHPAIEEAFEEIAAIERLMSFHRPDSDLTRFNHAAAGETVTLDPRTVEVFACALELARESRGIFDVTVGAELVAGGVLPPPSSQAVPDPGGSWRDIEILGPDRIRLHRRLWADLGGIAKGYAVDQAIARLCREAGAQCVVNAGGDIRVSGPRSERVGTQDRDARPRRPACRGIGEWQRGQQWAYISRWAGAAIAGGDRVERCLAWCCGWRSADWASIVWKIRIF